MELDVVIKTNNFIVQAFFWDEFLKLHKQEIHCKYESNRGIMRLPELNCFYAWTQAVLPFLLKIQKTDPIDCAQMFQRSSAENRKQHRVSTIPALNNKGPMQKHN